MTALDWILAVIVLIAYVIGMNTIGKNIEDVWRQTNSYKWLNQRPLITLSLFVVFLGSCILIGMNIRD